MKIDPAKLQVVECIVQLALRAKELGHESLYATLLVVAASASEGKGGDDTLALWIGEYAKLRLAGMPLINEPNEPEKKD